MSQGQECSSYVNYANEHEDASDCWPPGTTALSTPFIQQGFYSPGLDCPAGYTAACSATAGGYTGTPWPAMYALTKSQTAIGCCPSGFGCDSEDWHKCLAFPTISESFMAVTCSFGASTVSNMITLPTTPPGGVAEFDDYTVYAPLFEIRWESSDVEAMHTATSTLLSKTSSTTQQSSSLTTAPSPPTQPTTSGPRHHAISYTAGVALEISLPLLVALISILVAALFVHRRHKRKQSAPAELEGPAPPAYSEIHGTPLNEMEEQRAAQEIDGTGDVYEMEEQRNPQEMEQKQPDVREGSRTASEPEAGDPTETAQSPDIANIDAVHSPPGLKVVGQDDEIKPAL